MPQINDYSVPETEGQGAVGGISPNLEAAGAVGRGIQNLGGAIEQGADVMHRRQEQKEVSQVYSQVAGLRANYTKQLYQQYQNPDFDTEKFQQQYADNVNKIGDSLSTGRGRNYFNDQAARLGGDLLKRASVMQAQAQGQDAKTELQKGVNVDSNTLASHPEQFHDLMDAQLVNLKTQIQGNYKLAPVEASLTKYVKGELAKAAVRGYANVDPGSEENEREGTATQMLNKGAFDEYFDNDTKTQMLAYAKRQAQVADIRNGLSEKSQNLAHKKEYAAWSLNFLSKINDGTASLKDLGALNSKGDPILTGDEAFKWEERLGQHAKEDFKGNTRLMDSTIQKARTGQITDASQVLDLVGAKGLSATQAKNIMSLVPLNDDVKDRLKSEKNMLGMMQKVPGDAMKGTEDLFRERSNQFFSDLQQKKKEQVAAGKPIGDLFDPNNKDYFGSDENVAKYRPTMQEQAQFFQSHFQKKTLESPEAKDNPKMRKPGEDFGAWKARTKDMK